jgi:hypothetical protein
MQFFLSKTAVNHYIPPCEGTGKYSKHGTAIHWFAILTCVQCVCILQVIESMLERHKGAARMENMPVMAREKAKTQLAAELAAEVVTDVTNLR